MCFDVVLCKYELFFEKLLSINMRKIIWTVRLESLLQSNPYINVDDVVSHESN